MCSIAFRRSIDIFRAMKNRAVLPTGRQVKHLEFRYPRSYMGKPDGFVETYEGFSYIGFNLTPERQRNVTERIIANQCGYCGGELEVVHRAGFQSLDLTGGERVEECQRCGNWRACRSTSISNEEWTIPYIREFDPQRHVAALTRLDAELAANPARLYSVHSRDFEIFVGSVLGSFFQCEVFHVGRSRDGGIDLVVIAGPDGPLMVQAKRRRSSLAVEGVEVVKLLFASLASRSSTRGMIVTTAQRFTKDAKEWMSQPALCDYQFSIELVALDRLLSMTKRIARSSDPGWVPVVDIWRASEPGVRHWGQGGGYANLSVLFGDGRRLRWSEFRKVKGFRGLARLPFGTVIYRTAESDSKVQRVLFLDQIRDKCWVVRDESVLTIASGERLLSGETIEGVEPVDGPSFAVLLGTLPPDINSLVVQVWADAVGASAVSWGY